MIRWLRSRSLILAVGAALASGFNFYSFVFLPTLVGTANLEGFVRTNYLGGLYLFGVASSIAPFSAYVFMSGKGDALFRYAMISLVIFTLVGMGGVGLVNTAMSFVCLGAAFCMQIAGFFLASLIRQEKILAASALQMFQPMLFAGLLTLHEFGGFSELNWPYSYSLSCFIFVIIIAATGDWRWLIKNLTESTPIVTSWRSILARIAMSVSFPLFFQLELILVGNFSSINLGDYAMVQKLYASVAISLFGSIGLRLVMTRGDFLESAQPLVDKRVIVMAIVVLCVVLLVGFGLSFLKNAHEPSVGLVIGSAIVSAIYTLASFVSLLAATFKPYLAFKALIFSLSVYVVGFYLVAPQNSVAVLMLSGVLFLAYIFFCHLSTFKK
jgi:hypothetical protein